MESQLPKSRQPTLMERIFRHWDYWCPEAEGIINTKHLSALLQNLHPESEIDEEELQKIIAQHDRNGIGSGQLDFDSVTKIIFNFLMKQSTDSTSLSNEFFFSEDQINGENRLSIDDFIIFNNL